MKFKYILFALLALSNNSLFCSEALATTDPEFDTEYDSVVRARQEKLFEKTTKALQFEKEKKELNAQSKIEKIQKKLSELETNKLENYIENQKNALYVDYIANLLGMRIDVNIATGDVISTIKDTNKDTKQFQKITAKYNKRLTQLESPILKKLIKEELKRRSRCIIS